MMGGRGLGVACGHIKAFDFEPFLPSRKIFDESLPGAGLEEHGRMQLAMFYCDLSCVPLPIGGTRMKRTLSCSVL